MSDAPPLPFDGAASPGPEPEAGREARLAGAIERVTYHDEESGFCVLRVRVVGRSEPVAVVGRAPSVLAGQYVQAEGRWERDPKHGLQLRAEELALAAPSTPEGIERYLASGLVPGIGPEMAKRLVKAFGADVFEVIERTPVRLREVPGVGPQRARNIGQAWRDKQSERELMVFLHSHGVGTARAAQIQRAWGEEAIERIQADPYALAREIRGIGFPTADKLAERLGVARDARVRLRAGVRHVLEEARGDGHCGLLRQNLVERAVELLGVDAAGAESAIDAELGAERDALVADTLSGSPAIFLPALHAAERDAARRLLALAQGDPPWRAIDVPRALEWLESEHGLQLAPSQQEAVELLARSKVGVLTGGPGVGKTTLVRALLELVRAKGARVQLAAPTGRAAKRLAEATGAEARTLHRLLEADPRSGGFRRGVGNPVECDWLVVDEASMIDATLFAATLRALAPASGLLLVGDVDQLPSVGPGQVLRDVIASEAVSVVRLREIFRQAEESGIVRAAHCIGRGELPDLDASGEGDFFFVSAEDADEAAERVLTVVAERIPKRFGLDPVRDVQVLSPMHRGSTGARNLNAELQARLNPPVAGEATLERFGVRYARGDKVMQSENDYEKDVYNGDLGVVAEVDAEDAAIEVDFDGRSVRYERRDIDQLALAYATTVHKAQGSEYPAVVIPLTTQHMPMLERTLLYTAVTRARRLAVIVGQKRALTMAVQRAGERKRTTKLKEWLTAKPNPATLIPRT